MFDFEISRSNMMVVKETNQTSTKMEVKHKTMEMRILKVIMDSINMTKMARN